MFTENLTPAEKRAVNDLIRIAGGEHQFANALLTMEKRLRRTPTGDELLDFLLRRRIAEKTVKLAEMRKKGNKEVRIS